MYFCNQAWDDSNLLFSTFSCFFFSFPFFLFAPRRHHNFATTFHEATIIVYSKMIWFNLEHDANYYTIFFSLFCFYFEFLFDWLTFSCATSRLISLNLAGFLFHRFDCLHNVCVYTVHNMKRWQIHRLSECDIIGNLCTVHQRCLKILHSENTQSIGCGA